MKPIALAAIPQGAVVFGEMSSPATLEQAGIGKAGVLAAVTDKDEANLVITTLARFSLSCPLSPMPRIMSWRSYLFSSSSVSTFLSLPFHSAHTSLSIHVR